MNRKYEFVPGDEITIAPGRTVKRIRALVAISYFVAAGSLGGYIENEKCLSSDGNAWVYGNAQVSGDAWVSGNGLIFWASHVGTANGTLTAYSTKDNGIELTRGCFKGSIDEFLSKSEKEHDDQTHLEYRLLIEVAYSRITRARGAK